MSLFIDNICHIDPCHAPGTMDTR